MPNKWTFKIKPIGKLVNKYVGTGKRWIDPFAGMYSPAFYTNDLNPLMPAKFHQDALDFCNNNFGYIRGCLFDPPYSYRQITDNRLDINLTT
jgi:hypothetical protein